MLEHIKNNIICSDAKDILPKLPDNCIDLTITSPPYNKKEKYGGVLVKEVKYDTYKDFLEEEQYQMEQVNILNEIYRITKMGGSLFYNHKVRYENGQMIHPVIWLYKTKWTIWQEIIWNRKIAGNIRGWRFWSVDERIYWLVKGKPKELPSEYAQMTSVWEIRPESGHKNHPAPFPIELPYRIIKAVLHDKGIVLDPFCGTGTTLVVAKILGKDYIGIDISENYVEYAKNRINNIESDYYYIINKIEKNRLL